MSNLRFRTVLGTRTLRTGAILSIGVLLVLAVGCAKPKVTVQVSKDRIQQGQDVNVSWTSKDAKAVTLNGEKVNNVGSKSFTPGTTTTYTAVAKRGDKEARDSKTVDVTGRPVRPTISIAADPDAVIQGESTTLRWSSTNADRVTITDLGTVPGSGSRAISPTQPTTYTATATGPGGDESASTRVNVLDRDRPNRNTTDTTDNSAAIAALFHDNVRNIYFAYDKADLTSQARETLRHAAEWLTQSPNRSIAFKIEGSCDPRGTEEYNLGLGERRAQVAKEFLATLGVSQGSMQTISYGKERASGTSEGNPSIVPSWAHDRNDTFVYLSGGHPEPPQILFLF